MITPRQEVQKHVTTIVLPVEVGRNYVPKQVPGTKLKNIRELRIHDPMTLIFITSSNTLLSTPGKDLVTTASRCVRQSSTLYFWIHYRHFNYETSHFTRTCHRSQPICADDNTVFNCNLFSRRYSSATRNISPTVARSGSSLQNKLFVIASPSMYQILGVRGTWPLTSADSSNWRENFLPRLIFSSQNYFHVTGHITNLATDNVGRWKIFKNFASRFWTQKDFHTLFVGSLFRLPHVAMLFQW
jgi:hypothetical protein